MDGDLLAVPAPAGVERALRAGAVVDADRDPDVVGVLGNGVDGTGDGDAQRAGVDDGPRRNVDDDLAGGAAHQVHRCGPVPAGYRGGAAHCEPDDAQLRPARRAAVDPDGGRRLHGVGGRVRGGVLLGVDEAGRMSGAGATSRVRATAGVTTAWGRALHAELLKVVTLPAMWWSAAVAGAAAIATMMSVLQNVVDGRDFGFEEIAPMWTLAVQIGFVAAGVAAAGAEHSTAQGMTSLLVTPARGRLAAARLMVLTGTGLVAASVLVGASLAACPTMSTAALWAGGRTVVWLTAVLLLAAGLGAALRSVIGASTAAVVLVILTPQLAVFLGDAARWFPGQAGQIWLTAAESQADVTSAGLIILAWTTATQMAGFVRLVRADT